MGIHEVTYLGDLWRFETADVVKCQHTVGKSQDLPWRAGSNEAVNNKRPSLLLPKHNFSPFFLALSVSLGRIPCVT
jgi:hypothetical protein